MANEAKRNNYYICKAIPYNRPFVISKNQSKEFINLRTDQEIMTTIKENAFELQKNIKKR